MENKRITEYNRIIDFICSLNIFTLEELEEKLGIYLEGLELNYKKLEPFINNAILYLVFSDRFKIEKNHFINNHNNKQIDEEDQTRLLRILDNIGDDIYLTTDKKTHKYIKLQKEITKKV